MAGVLLWAAAAGWGWGEVREAVWGESAGEPVRLFTLGTPGELEAEVTSYGATLVEVRTPDRDGTVANVVLRLDDLAAYLGPHPSIGCTVGRFANRIGGGGFVIDGVRHDLDSVNARTGVHIHGGKTGFQRQNWRASVSGPDAVTFSWTSPDGHEGYPGQVEAAVTYRVEAGRRLVTEFTARTTAATHVNLTNHTYWNLGGREAGPVLDHVLRLAADQVLEIDDRKIPTGRFLSVAGGAFDFRNPRRIGDGLAAAGGYDHCFRLRSGGDGGGDGEVAWLRDPRSGREMTVESDAPAVQLYTANHLGPQVTHQGRPYGPHHGVCLEFQHPPDAPNRPEFPSTLLRPGEVYRQRTVYRFHVPGK
jgi:aldose 1-epimerase